MTNKLISICGEIESREGLFDFEDCKKKEWDESASLWSYSKASLQTLVRQDQL